MGHPHTDVCSLLLHLHEVTHQCSNLIGRSVQGEVTSFEDVNLSVGYVLVIALRLAEIKRQVILAPDHQQARLFLAHPGLPLRVGIYIGSIVVEDVALYVPLTGLTEKSKLIGPKIRIVALHVWIISHMTCSRCLQREKIGAKRALVGGSIGPERSPRLPIRAQSFVVRHSVLNNQGFCALGMRKHHAKTYRAAVVLHVERVARQPESFSEVIHDLRIVIKGIRKLLRIWPVAVSVARVIWSNKVIAIRKPGKEGFEHSGRCWNSVQQEDGGRVLRAGLSVEDRDSVNLDGSIKGRVLHRAFLSLGLRQQLR